MILSSLLSALNIPGVRSVLTVRCLFSCALPLLHLSSNFPFDLFSNDFSLSHRTPFRPMAHSTLRFAFSPNHPFTKSITCTIRLYNLKKSSVKSRMSTRFVDSRAARFLFIYSYDDRLSFRNNVIQRGITLRRRIFTCNFLHD